MSYYKCNFCDSILFEQIQPQVFDETGVRVYSTNSIIKPEHTSISVLRCLNCGVIFLPSCSLIGKNALDIDVQIYRELYNLVQEYNKELIKDKFKYDSRINSINAEIAGLNDSLSLVQSRLGEISITKEVTTETEEQEVLKEEPKKNVKTGRPRKKDS